MSTPLPFDGRVALVTGAAGGIGRALALALAQRRCHLALADVNATGLAETAALVQAMGVRASRHPLDVCDRVALAALPAAVHAEHGRLDILVNNAGVAVGGTFEQVSQADFEWLFEINFWAVVRLTRACLPLLRQSDAAQIVNLSSVYGIVSPPGQTAYSASKFAVRGFSNALRHELAGSSVGVTVVHPGGVATAIARSARLPAGTPEAVRAEGVARANRLLKMPPEQAGEIIVQAVGRRTARVLVGSDAKVAAFIEWLLPVNYWRLLGRALPKVGL